VPNGEWMTSCIPTFVEKAFGDDHVLAGNNPKLAGLR